MLYHRLSLSPSSSSSLYFLHTRESLASVQRAAAIVSYRSSLTGPLLQFPVGRNKLLPPGNHLLTSPKPSLGEGLVASLRIADSDQFTLPFPQTPLLGKVALSLCSDFETQRQAESSVCSIHPELFFWAQVGLGGWPSGLTRPSGQSTTSRYLLPDRLLHFAVADTRVQRISFRPLRLPRKNQRLRQAAFGPTANSPSISICIWRPFRLWPSGR